MDRNELIRQRAHQIWEADGNPEGQEANHWQQAQEQLRQEGQLDEFGIPDELPDLTTPHEGETPGTGQADGHVIGEDEGGLSDMPDEAQQAVDDPGFPTNEQTR